MIAFEGSCPLHDNFTKSQKTRSALQAFTGDFTKYILTSQPGYTKYIYIYI